MGIRAVLFDVGDTLWHAAAAPPPAVFRQIAAERAEAFLSSIGRHADDPGAAARACWDALESAMREARLGDLAEPGYAAAASAAARDVGLDLTNAEAAAFLDAIYVSGAEGGKEPYPGADDMLRTLRARGFLLGIVTNRAFGGERFRSDLRETNLDVGWDAIAVSVEVGFLKPHPALFEHALTALGVQPSQAVMVGNSLLEDVAGAQALGIRAAWKRSTPDAEGVLPDFEFDDLRELPTWDLLACGPSSD